MLKQKVLITGANGFIGSYLVKEALNSGLDVYAAVRKNSDTSTLEKLDITLITIDFEDIDKLTEIFSQYAFDFLIHNAGITKTPKESTYIHVNSGYLQNLILAINKSGNSMKKLLLMSSLASFGPADFASGGVVSRNSSPNPVSAYGRSKLAAEQILTSQHEIPYCIIRPTAVYGPGEKDLLNVFKMVTWGINTQVGFTDQKLTFIYVKDLARLILSALTSPNNNTSYFAADGNIYSSDALAKVIGKTINKRYITLKLPISLVKLMAYFAEKMSHFVGNYPALNIDKVNELKARSWACDTNILNEELGFKAMYDLEKGVPETTTWYQENKWI